MIYIPVTIIEEQETEPIIYRYKFQQIKMNSRQTFYVTENVPIIKKKINYLV